MFFLLLSTLLAGAAAQCQNVGKPCALASSNGGLMGNGGVGVCVAAGTAFGSGQCQPQCRDASTNACFVSTTSATTDGVCQMSPGSSSLTCVAKQTNPNPACAVDRPCTLNSNGNSVGVCQNVNGVATCKAQCQQSATGTPTMAAACFPDLMSQQRDGVCNANLVCVRQSNEPPACDAGAKCRLTAAGSNTAEVGICVQGGCVKQCQSTVGSMGASGCYTNFNVNSFDGNCENGACKPKVVMPPAGCQKVLDACQNGNVSGKCTKNADGALQCSVLTDCNAMASPKGVSQCTYVSSEGYLKSGVCSQNGCGPAAPQCQAGGRCKTADNLDGTFSNSCDCIKNQPMEQCSASNEGAKCQLATASGVAAFGVCKQGKCEGSDPNPQCTPGERCKLADGSDGKFSNSCVCSKENTVVQQCSDTTEGSKCQLPNTGIQGSFGVCKQGKCEGSAQCQVGGPCKAADGSDGKFTNTCQCAEVQNPNPVMQCTPNTEGAKCQAANSAGTVGSFGVCKGSKCDVSNTPRCDPGGLCYTKEQFEGKFNDNCECVKRPVPNEVCPKDGEKCQLQTATGNTMSTQSGVCKEGKCVVVNAPTPCKDGAFCQPAEGQRGVCRAGNCEAVKCMSDDNCLSSDSSTKLVCLAFQCVPAPSTLSNPCSSNIKCENGGKCVVVNGANAGFSDAQLKQSTEVASTFENFAGVCACPAGFTGATCSVKTTTMEKPAACSCSNGLVSRDNLCVQANIKACTCDQKCVCTNDSSDQCSAPEKMGVPSTAPTGSVIVLSVVFSNDKSNLLQALGTVKSLLEKYDSIQVSAEKTDVGLRVTASVKGAIDPELANSVKQAAASLLGRDDVVDAVVQDAAAEREPATTDSSSTLTIGVAAVLFSAVLMN